VSPGETFVDSNGWVAKRPTRLALVSAGYADGYPRGASESKLAAIVSGRRCLIVGQPSMDLLAVDVTDVSATRPGEMVTLVGPEISIDDLAAASTSTSREIISHLGHRFHRIYHVT